MIEGAAILVLLLVALTPPTWRRYRRLAALTDHQLCDLVWERAVKPMGLPVFPVTTGMWSRRTGKDSAGQYDGNVGVIRLRPDYYRNPWVLAHEIGHHVAITRSGDHSEAAADSEGYRLMRRILMWRWLAFRREAEIMFCERYGGKQEIRDRVRERRLALEREESQRGVPA